MLLTCKFKKPVVNYNTSKNTWNKNRAERPTQTAQKTKINLMLIGPRIIVITEETKNQLDAT